MNFLCEVEVGKEKQFRAGKFLYKGDIYQFFLNEKIVLKEYKELQEVKVKLGLYSGRWNEPSLRLLDVYV